MPFWDVGGLNSENPAKRVRKHNAIGAEVPLPPAKMRDPLRLFQSRFILAQLIHCPFALSEIESCDQGFEHLSPPVLVVELSPTVWALFVPAALPLK
jgi:hypothetical protein